MRKIALVICEGETEENYLNLIKKWYKSPVRIISHIEGTKITQALVEKHEQGLKISSKDKVDTFLMCKHSANPVFPPLKVLLSFA